MRGRARLTLGVMPEGDAVFRTARRLHQALAGSAITVWQLRWPSLAATDKRGCTTTEVVSRGKHLLQRLDDGSTLHSHLRMDGRWRVTPAPAKAPGLGGDHRIRALVGSAQSLATGVSLGELDLLSTARETDVIGHLGPDVLGVDWSPELVLTNLANSPRRELGAALLDQRNVAGFGTIWVGELCFIERLSPWTPVGEVAPERLESLLGKGRELMQRTVHYPTTVTTGNPRRPQFIYGATRHPCPRCGTWVRTGTVGEGVTKRQLNYCPHCQPGAVPPTDEPQRERPPRRQPRSRY